MSNFRPLVIDPAAETPVKQLQSGDDLDIPLNQRVDELETKLDLLTQFLIDQDIEVPEELVG